MRFEKTVVGLGAAVAFVAATAFALPALAQDDPATDTTVDSASSPVRHRGGLHLATAADVLGIDAADLHDRLEAGESIADIAAAESVAIDDVIDALVAEAEEHLAGAVGDGRVGQAEADERLAAIEQRITEAVNGEAPFGLPHGRGPGTGFFGPFGRDTVAGVLGIDAVDLHDRLEAGESIADIAAAEGVAIGDVTAAMEAAATERLAQAVIDGRLTQEEADEMLTGLAGRIDAFVDGEVPLGGRHGLGAGDAGTRGFGHGATAYDTAAKTADA